MVGYSHCSFGEHFISSAGRLHSLLADGMLNGTRNGYVFYWEVQLTCHSFVYVHICKRIKIQKSLLLVGYGPSKSRDDLYLKVM